MNSMKIQSATKAKADVYRFTFSECFSWAIFTICEDTGEFSVQSDWGNGSHRWNMNHIGADSLKEFLSTTNGDYVATKFSYDNPAFNQGYCPEATALKVRDEIVRLRKGHFLTKEEAALAWDQFNDACFDSYDSLTALADSDFGEIVSDYESIYTEKDSIIYNEFSTRLLPFFFEYLKKELSQ